MPNNVSYLQMKQLFNACFFIVQSISVIIHGIIECYGTWNKRMFFQRYGQFFIFTTLFADYSDYSKVKIRPIITNIPVYQPNIRPNFPIIQFFFYFFLENKPIIPIIPNIRPILPIIQNFLFKNSTDYKRLGLRSLGRKNRSPTPDSSPARCEPRRPIFSPFNLIKVTDHG